jgi:hypothetical protein
MTIETKYNPNDPVWVMRNGRPDCLIIDSVDVSAFKLDNRCEEPSITITYKLIDYGLYSYGTYGEKEICVSREELIRRLDQDLPYIIINDEKR